MLPVATILLKKFIICISSEDNIDRKRQSRPKPNEEKKLNLISYIHILS